MVEKQPRGFAVASDWYAPGQIRYIRADILWMIAVVLPLEAGQWPPEPTETTGRSKSRSAPFENPAVVRAEVEERLKMTKSDGETLVWEIQKGGIEYYDFLCPAAKMALNYICSGKKRRKVSYSKWYYDQKRKNRKKSENK
mgnify:CR=1 FL=1|jgi:hypothetical protein